MKRAASGRLISVVIPVYNEAECIANTVQVVQKVLESANFEYEILVVDDGSTDETLELVQEISRESAEVRVLSLNLNRGHMKALEAGLRASTGDYIVAVSEPGTISLINCKKGSEGIAD
jgi:dolichol-phosphate mannosyltransferase